MYSKRVNARQEERRKRKMAKNRKNYFALTITVAIIIALVSVLLLSNQPNNMARAATTFGNQMALECQTLLLIAVALLPTLCKLVCLRFPLPI